MSLTKGVLVLMRNIYLKIIGAIAVFLSLLLGSAIEAQEPTVVSSVLELPGGTTASILTAEGDVVFIQNEGWPGTVGFYFELIEGAPVWTPVTLPGLQAPRVAGGDGQLSDLEIGTARQTQAGQRHSFWFEGYGTIAITRVRLLNSDEARNALPWTPESGCPCCVSCQRWTICDLKVNLGSCGSCQCGGGSGGIVH